MVSMHYYYFIIVIVAIGIMVIVLFCKIGNKYKLLDVHFVPALVAIIILIAFAIFGGIEFGLSGNKLGEGGGIPLTVEMLREGPFLKVVTHDEESGLSQITLVKDKDNSNETQGKMRVISGLGLEKDDVFFIKDDVVIVIK